jgi:hypothetical protein
VTVDNPPTTPPTVGRACTRVCGPAADGCPMTNGGACPTDQKVIDKCPEC